MVNQGRLYQVGPGKQLGWFVTPNFFSLIICTTFSKF
jgi:hypothetical protein